MRSIVIEDLKLLYKEANSLTHYIGGTCIESVVKFYLEQYPRECIFTIYADLYSLDLTKTWWEQEIRKNLPKVRRFLELQKGEFI